MLWVLIGTTMSNTRIFNGDKSFKELERDPVYGFKNRIFKSDNINIKVLVNSLFDNTSNVTNYWNAIL